MVIKDTIAKSANSISIVGTEFEMVFLKRCIAIFDFRRWVRLLFGREFDLQDLLVLWDALFADSRSLDLVDYIFVAMMFNIRQERKFETGMRTRGTRFLPNSKNENA